MLLSVIALASLGAVALLVSTRRAELAALRRTIRAKLARRPPPPAAPKLPPWAPKMNGTRHHQHEQPPPRSRPLS